MPEPALRRPGRRPTPPEPVVGSPALAAIPPELRAPRGGITLLLAGDTPANLEFKLSLLEPAGYRVELARDGVDALAQVREKHVDLVISDVSMQGGSGFDLLAEIRTDPSLCDLPFMLLTSTAGDSQSQAQGMALGANRYLLRPIGPVDLLKEIRACLAGP